MTYDELATALGITPDSARRLVARKKWSRSPGNDGKARVHVPPDVIPDIRLDVRGNKQPLKADELELQVVRLEGEIQLLKNIIEIERRISAEVRDERNAWQKQAERLSDQRIPFMRKLFR